MSTTETIERAVAAPRGRSGGLSMDGVWAIVAVALPAITTLMSRLTAIDLAYQVRAGNLMIDSHQMLRTDVFTFTAFGRPWLNQQWAAQVLLAIPWRLGGWNAVAFVWAIMVAAIAYFLYRATRGADASPRTAALLTLGGFLVGLEIFGMRPQLFGVLLFAATQWIVVTRATHPARLWLVPALMVLWVNAHGSFPLALVVLGLAWLEDLKPRPELARRIAWVAAATAGVSLLNPYGPRVWRYVIDLARNPVVAQRVGEWQPPTIHSQPGLFFFLSVLGVLVFVARYRGSVPWLTLVRVALFAAVALMAIRGVVWWALVAPVVVASTMAQSDRMHRVDRSPLNLGIVVALVALALIALPFRRGVNQVTGAPDVVNIAPQRLVEAAESATPEGSRWFASQIDASWVEFSAPSHPVVVDSRIEIFPERIWQDYFAVSLGTEGWQSTLDEWRIEALILHPDQAEGLLEVVDGDAGWRLVFRDHEGSVYVRS
ncbi:MAG TPA: hypothetical protein VGR41_04480 [Actinomycetota bacterium]|jgi:hypothetical protein|nr:hypothetical protein [Actinomycetota bacterium]